MIDLRVYHRDMQRFYEHMGWPVRHDFDVLSEQEAKRRNLLITEELQELHQAKTLEDTIDALVDIGYIAMGNLMSSGYCYNYAKKDTVPANPKECSMKGVLNDQIYVRPLTHVEVQEALIANKLHLLFDQLHNHMVNGFEESPIATAVNSCAILMRAADIAHHLGLNYWDHWTEVHTCNMNKVPATVANPSSRGLVEFDAVKPSGWQGPDHQSIINKRGSSYDYSDT